MVMSSFTSRDQSLTGVAAEIVVRRRATEFFLRLKAKASRGLLGYEEFELSG